MTLALHDIPTNIVSGFLGSGKTTAVLHLFRHKPRQEKWAVLVNEFGEVGIDGKLFQQHGIAVREIPGGCRCCAQGLPLQVAIMRLLRAERPQRLLIESSGVGHPAEVLKTLQGDGLRQVLRLQAGICLLDPMHLLDERYRQNALFLEQLALADMLVANKTDLASAEALQHFQSLHEAFDPPKALLTETRYGALQHRWLQLPHSQRTPRFAFTTIATAPGWQSHSFVFDDDTVFDADALRDWLAEGCQQQLLRIKGIVQTRDDAVLINATATDYRMDAASGASGNVIEIIGTGPDTAALQRSLQACIAR